MKTTLKKMYGELNLILLLMLAMLLTTFSCTSRKIVYSGMNDLVFGSHSFILYSDKTFYIEIGLGGTEGSYQINHDTVRLTYFDKPNEDWPDVMLVRQDYFISPDSLNQKKYLKISRTK